MQIETLVIVYVIGILIEIGIVFIKPRYISFIPVIATCISFLCIKDSNLFNLALIQTFILVIGLLVFYLVDAHIYKKNNKKIDKTKIQDL